MKNCPNCGAQVAETANMCPTCGSAVNTVAPEQQVNVNQTQAPQPTQAPVQAAAPNQTGVDTNTEKGLAVLAYIIPLIPFLMKPKTEFGKFHTNQGMNIWIIWIIFIVAKSVISNFLPSIIGSLLGMVGLLFTVCDIMGIVYACQGQMKEVPVLGSIKIVK